MARARPFGETVVAGTIRFYDSELSRSAPIRAANAAYAGVYGDPRNKERVLPRVID